MSTGNWSCLILSRRVIVLALLVVSVIGLCAQSAGAATLWNSVQSPNGRSHSINQEASGRSRAVIGTCAYDADANPPSVADPTRSQTKYTYDTPAQVVHDFYVVVTGGTGVLVHNVDGPTRPGCDDEPVGTASGGAEAPAEGGESTLSNFGNASGPKAGRPSDFGISSSDETVGPFSPTAPTDDVPGASTFRDPATSGLTGHYWNIPADTELADGLGFHADGADVGGNAPFGHVTIYPTAGMTFEEFQGLVQGLPWEYGGKI